MVFMTTPTLRYQEAIPMTDAYSDLLGDDEDEDEQPDQQSADKGNKAFAQMRKEKREAEKRAQDAEAALATLQTQTRNATLEAVARDAGVKGRHAKFYPADAEVTPEAFRAWAVTEEFLTGEENEALPAEQERGFTPTVINEGQALGAKTYSYEEWRELARSDQDKAMQAWQAGRVQPEVPPWDTGTPVA